VEEIGKRVATLRISRQISQRELAVRCGVSQPTIANIERGRTKEVKGFVLEALARELTTKAGYILHGEGSADEHETDMMLIEVQAAFKKLARKEQETLLRFIRAMQSSA
jgi:transcriptional regulator with XRE-family HTH domain